MAYLLDGHDIGVALHSQVHKRAKQSGSPARSVVMEAVWEIVRLIVVLIAIGAGVMALLAMWRLFTASPDDDLRR